MTAERGRAGLAVAGCLLVAGALSLAWRPALSMPDSVRIPIVKPHPEGAPPDAALFRHGRHDTYGCAGCHPALFPQYGLGFTHEHMREGRFCGVCHDGRAATDVTAMSCEECHVPR
jgi:c(7)-type cytochrome triheme protein